MDPTRLFLLILSSCFAVNLAGAQGALNGSGLSNITETALDDVTLDDEKPCHEGQIINHGCDEVCNCQNGQLQCWPRCTGPLVKSSLGSQDPHCHLKAEDECCSTLICSHSKIKDGSVEYCEYGNQTYNIGETFQMGCISICKCAPGGNVECKPRCPPTNNTNSDSDRCLTVADKKDPCCKILYCDVNESDDIGLEEEEEEDHERNLVSAIPANNSAVILNFDSPLVPDDIKVEISQDNVSWVPTKASGHVVQDLIPGKTYYFRVVARSGYSNVVSSTLPKISSNSSDCEYKGKKYKKGVEFHDDCSAYCICAEEGVECAPFKCPTYFGLDVLDPQCLKWETRPADFKPEPPRCCPDSVVCVNNGSCLYKGEMFENWADIPTKLSGCDMKCYCQAGNVTCSPRCPPVPAAPPQHIHCPLNAVPIVSHPPDDNCCLNWMCPSSNGLDSNSTQPTTNKTLLNSGNYNSPLIPFPGPFNPNFIKNKTNVFYNVNQNDFLITDNLQTSKKIQSSAESPDEYNFKVDNKYSNNTKAYPDVHDNNTSHLINNEHLQLKIGSITERIQSEKENNSNLTNKVISGGLLDSKDPKLKYNMSFQNLKNNSRYNNIPIGIINPDSLPIGNEGPSYKPTLPTHNLKPSLLEHLLEYHQFQDSQSIVNKNLNEQVSPPTQSTFTIPTNNIGTIKQQNPSYPFQFKEVPQYTHQHIHLGVTPFEVNKNIPIQSNYHEFGLYPHQRPESPPNYVTLFNGLPQEVFHPPKTFIHNPQPNSQFVSPEELYLVENKDKLLPLTKQNQHPYLTVPTLASQSSDPNHNRSPVGLKLEDIIDDIKRHEETDSHASDVHVLLIPSRPQNFGQGVPQPPTPGFPSHPQEKNAITVHTVEAVDENTVRLVFSVPMILVGLHGRVELRYTADNKNSDPATWEQQVLAPPDDLIATPELEFKLENLQPDTEYKIKITVVMRDLQNSPASQILTVKTPPTSQASPPVIPVDPELHVVSSNSTSATVSWRKFTERELHFIDGVQLRYKEIEGKLVIKAIIKAKKQIDKHYKYAVDVYQATPLIHRAVTSYTIEDLKPESQYEVGILLIPFPGQTTELQAQKTVHLSTSIENDPYKFELTLDVHHIKSTSVEVTWSGVPYPEDKYVNIFRAIYQYDAGREDMNAFKVAKRDSPAGTLIQGLKPDTRYRLWIEAYLTNGKIKKSNVKDFITKKGHGAALNPNQGKLESSSMAEGNDYYGPLVGVSILAAIAILAAAGLLVVLAKKHGHNKAPITTAVQRKSLPHTAAYDNPSYKSCEGDSANGRRTAPSFEEP